MEHLTQVSKVILLVTFTSINNNSYCSIVGNISMIWEISIKDRENIKKYVDQEMKKLLKLS